jgi:hypothetical protein
LGTLIIEYCRFVLGLLKFGALVRQKVACEKGELSFFGRKICIAIITRLKIYVRKAHRRLQFVTVKVVIAGE